MDPEKKHGLEKDCPFNNRWIFGVKVGFGGSFFGSTKGHLLGRTSMNLYQESISRKDAPGNNKWITCLVFGLLKPFLNFGAHLGARDGLVLGGAFVQVKNEGTSCKIPRSIDHVLVLKSFIWVIQEVWSTAIWLMILRANIGNTNATPSKF